MPAGIPGDPPDVDEARRKIERLKARRADSLACAGALLGLLPLAVVWHPEAAAALLVGTVASIWLLSSAHMELHRCLETCASFVGMSRLPEVAEWQARLVSERRRRQLAARLRAIADAAPAPVDGGSTGTWTSLVLVDRVAGVREQLLEVAAVVERVDHPDPVTIARLWQLVSDGVHSPLYNPLVVAGELEVVLRQARWSLIMSE
jgi:hypothetical protein